MVSIAKIPLAGLHFTGCIAVVYWQGKEYRLATYKGVKIIRHSPSCVELKQGKHRLTITAASANRHPLFAPDRGAMTRTIHESLTCKARFRFCDGERVLFDLNSDHAGFEHV